MKECMEQDYRERFVTYRVVLEQIGEKKVDTIKEIRAFINCDLKTAKDIVDSTPEVVAEKLTYMEAERIQGRLMEIGNAVVVEDDSVQFIRKEKLPEVNDHYWYDDKYNQTNITNKLTKDERKIIFYCILSIFIGILFIAMPFIFQTIGLVKIIRWKYRILQVIIYASAAFILGISGLVYVYKEKHLPKERNAYIPEDGRRKKLNRAVQRSQNRKMLFPTMEWNIRLCNIDTFCIILGAVVFVVLLFAVIIGQDDIRSFVAKGLIIGLGMLVPGYYLTMTWGKLKWLKKEIAENRIPYEIYANDFMKGTKYRINGGYIFICQRYTTCIRPFDKECWIIENADIACIEKPLPDNSLPMVVNIMIDPESVGKVITLYLHMNNGSRRYLKAEHLKIAVILNDYQRRYVKIDDKLQYVWKEMK